MPLSVAKMADNIEAYVLLSLVVVIILLRTIFRVRTVGFSGLQLDDYLMPLAGVSCPFFVPRTKLKGD